MSYEFFDKNSKDYNRLKNLHDKCFIDLTNKKFGKLTAISIDHKHKKDYYWKCICDCGKEVIVSGIALRSGHTKSCGCLHKKALLKDLTNHRFGNLVVKEYYGKIKKNHYWKCICDCGNLVIVNGANLRAGQTRSCGCLKRTFHKAQQKYNLSGNHYGSLTVLTRMVGGYWLCRCDCGNYRKYKTSDLLRGNLVSCGCRSSNIIGSTNELDIKEFIKIRFPNILITKCNILKNGKRGYEIDIYMPELKLGIEYNGSAFHASKNGVYGNKDKYYHRNKFLLAREQGIHLISVFDIDYEIMKHTILCIILKSILNIPRQYNFKDVMYTNNDYDDGSYLVKNGYEEVCQLEPDFYVKSKHKYLVYRCGVTKWRRITPR